MKQVGDQILKKFWGARALTVTGDPASRNQAAKAGVDVFPVQEALVQAISEPEE